MKRRRRYSIFDRFIYGLEEKNSQSEVIFAVFRLPSAVNVMLNLSKQFNAPVKSAFDAYLVEDYSLKCLDRVFFSRL